MIKNFLVISGSANKVVGTAVFGYGPYVNELNLWLKHVDTATIIAPLNTNELSPIDIEMAGNVKFVPVPEVSVKSPKELVKALIYSPYILFVIAKHMLQADLVHVRAPSNLGLLGSVVQVFFPSKKKLAKYAANFDPHSNQPFFNRLQRKILKSPILTKNMRMLVYGNWPDATKNCKSFFTATYRERDIIDTPPRPINKEVPIKLIFVGTLRDNKKPVLSIQTCVELRKLGYDATLDLYGDGPERKDLEEMVRKKDLESFVTIRGNQTKETVKEAFQKAHFLIFISKSEGWPKVVAESMFWGCVPITTAVSMVPEMIGNQERGALIKPNVPEVVTAITQLIESPHLYQERSQQAMNWSRQYTVDKFEQGISDLVQSVK